MYCNAFVSWEIQDKVKLRSIISQTVLNKSSDIDEPIEQDSSHTSSAVPKSFVQLCPFQHPELSNLPSSRDTCELRLFCSCDSGRHGGGGGGGVGGGGSGACLHTASVAATAKVAEVYDSRGEYTCTIRGAPIGSLASSWCRFTYSLPEPRQEIRFKFLSLATPGCLKLASISLMILLPDGDSTVPIVNQTSSTTYRQPTQTYQTYSTSPQRQSAMLSPTATQRNQQQQQQQQSLQQPQLVTAAASRHALNNLRQWLDTRLEGIERRLDDRLSGIEAQLAQLVAIQSAAANQEVARPSPALIGPDQTGQSTDEPA
ncbi:hypothetical protein BOX15_Mlig023407g2 [Macrostomum lignano]|uniref:Uncharacterized protein n=1 Tax=Macrostomum lignano TaxID=282301 RepID=A0A267FP08_9PLAT|nr:hypothetical protein BOX15_Mlig023407g2 [Macrostomum lignano]